MFMGRTFYFNFTDANNSSEAGIWQTEVPAASSSFFLLFYWNLSKDTKGHILFEGRPERQGQLGMWTTPLIWVWPSAPMVPTSFWWWMLREGDGWLVTNSFQFTKVHPAFSEPLWNAFREIGRMEFNNNSPQLQSEYSDLRSSWGQLFSCFVLTVFSKALSEGPGRACGIHILRDKVGGRPLGSRPSSQIWQMCVSTSHQQCFRSTLTVFSHLPHQQPTLRNNPPGDSSA